MAAPLLTTKLYIPLLRPDAVSRPRLTGRLTAGLRHRLTLVSAPAGSGKTTLLSEWVHCEGIDKSPRTPGTAVLPPARAPIQFAWLSLDEGDNDPTRFLTYLVAALQTVAPEIGQAALAMSQAPQPPPPESLLATLINDLAALPHPVVLVLDDYHVIEAPPVHQQLTFLLEHGPTPGLHLALLTRQDPPLPLSRLRARGQMTEIRQADLQFTEQESAELLQGAMQLELSSADVSALHRRTEGWVVGLQLAALSLRGRDDSRQFVRSFAGSNRYVLDYLVDEVFERQPAAIQGFMLKTAILDRLTGALCDAVAEREDSRELLLALEQTNVFIVPLDDRREWYRYHQLFRDLLRAQCPEMDRTLLHQRAARWYEEQGYLDQAMTHSLAAEDWDGAERLMESAASQAIGNGQVLTLSRWLEAFPDARVRADAKLAAFQGWAWFMMGRVEPAATYADLAQELLPADAEPTVRAMVVCLRAYVAQLRFDMPQVIELAHEALDLLDESEPSGLRGAALGSLAGAQIAMGDLPAATQTLRSLARLGLQAGHPLSAVTALADLAWLLHLQGKTGEGIALCQQALDQCLDPRGNTLPLAGRAHSTLARIYADRNDLDRAHQHLVQAVELGEQLGPAEGLGSVIALAQLQQTMGEPEAALATIGEVRQVVAQFHVPQADALVAGAQAEIQLAQGNLAAVEDWAAAAGLSPTDSPDHLRESEFFAYARLLLAQKRWDETQTLLANCERFARDGSRHRSLITVRILQALFQQGLGHKRQALDCLEDALRLAAPGEYRRAFLDQGQSLLDLLPQVRHAVPAFVDSLLSASAKPYPARHPTLHPRADANRALIEPLSERELEVLGLVVAGLTNREIAEQLFISVGTVKTHTHHIYGKLGVTTRPRAIARARELALV